jgi:hypothetical protein
MKRLSVVLGLVGAGLVLLSALPAVAEGDPEAVSHGREPGCRTSASRVSRSKP